MGLLFYVYRRGIMAAARGDYRHKEVPSDDPYPPPQQQQQQQQPTPGPPGSSMQVSPNFAGGYVGAAAHDNPHNSMPPSTAGGATFAGAGGMGSPPFRYSMPPDASAYHQAYDGAYATPPPPPPESLYLPASEAAMLQPPDAMFQQQQQRGRSSTYASSVGPGEGARGSMEKFHAGQNVMAVHPSAATAGPPGQLVVAELEREPSRPYAELDPSPRYFAELGGHEHQPMAYAELPGARENAR